MQALPGHQQELGDLPAAVPLDYGIGLPIVGDGPTRVEKADPHKLPSYLSRAASGGQGGEV